VRQESEGIRQYVHTSTGNYNVETARATQTWGFPPRIQAWPPTPVFTQSVGRFLEHSRIYCFANGGAEAMFIGSADVMERNLGRRVETLIPVRDERILRHLRDVVLDAYVKDTDRATALDASGAYTRIEAGPAGRFNAQEFLLRYYSGSAQEPPTSCDA